MTVMTGLSGNEIYCLKRKGILPGDIVIGNSVFSLGFIGSVGSGFRNLAGGEIKQITDVVHEGRTKSYERMIGEAQKRGGIGVTGVTSQIIQHGMNIEFLSIGSCLHGEQVAPAAEQFAFSSSADGQELYCQIDSGFRPLKFVFGNVAYSIGIGGSLLGGLKGLTRGEVPQYSQVFNATRHLALQRIAQEAHQAGANAVLGIRTSIVPFRGMQEMVMIGTASSHPLLTPYQQTPVTSDLTNEEMWNLVQMGYMPLQLVLGVSVYSLGFVGKITSSFKRLARGEIHELMTLIYEARHNAINRIRADAELCGADDVAGIKTYVYDIGSGLIEFIAIGTAVKRIPGAETLTSELPPQAIIVDKDTFFNTAERALGVDLNRSSRSNNKRSTKKDSGPVSWKDVLKIVLKIAGG